MHFAYTSFYAYTVHCSLCIVRRRRHHRRRRRRRRRRRCRRWKGTHFCTFELLNFWTDDGRRTAGDGRRTTTQQRLSYHVAARRLQQRRPDEALSCDIRREDLTVGLRVARLLMRAMQFSHVDGC